MKKLYVLVVVTGQQSDSEAVKENWWDLEVVEVQQSDSTFPASRTVAYLLERVAESGLASSIDFSLYLFPSSLHFLFLFFTNTL